MSEDSSGSPQALTIERIFDAPVQLVWHMWTDPQHFAAWYGPDSATVTVAKMDVRPGGIFSIDIAVGDGPEVPNLGCFLEAIPMERLVWTSMLFPGYRPAVFDDIPITAIMTISIAAMTITQCFSVRATTSSGTIPSGSGRCRGSRAVDVLGPAHARVSSNWEGLV